MCMEDGGLGHKLKTELLGLGFRCAVANGGGGGCWGCGGSSWGTYLIMCVRGEGLGHKPEN
jgi:hypothetical protein